MLLVTKRALYAWRYGVLCTDELLVKRKYMYNPTGIKKVITHVFGKVTTPLGKGGNLPYKSGGIASCTKLRATLNTVCTYVQCRELCQPAIRRTVESMIRDGKKGDVVASGL